MKAVYIVGVVIYFKHLFSYLLTVLWKKQLLMIFVILVFIMIFLALYPLLPMITSFYSNDIETQIKQIPNAQHGKPDWFA